MAIPAGTKVFEESMDPTDILDFQINLAPILENGEGIASHTVVLPTESTLLGLELKTTGGYLTSLTNNVLTIWLNIIAQEQGNVAFVSGAILPIELTIVTNAVPPRKKQRTIAVEVKQR